MNKKLQVKDIVQATGISRETLRFYEQKGLLPKPVRSDAGYRQYDEEIINRLHFIKLAQEVDFSLKEIAQLLVMGKKKAISKADLQLIAKEKISSIDEKIQSLNKMKHLLQELSSRAIQVSKSNSCPILSQFNQLEF